MRNSLRLTTAIVAAMLWMLSAVPLGAQEPAPAALLRREIPFEYAAKGGFGTQLTLTTGAKGGVQISAWRKRSILVEARIELGAPTEADLDLLASAVTVLVDETPTTVAVTTTGPHDRATMKGLKGLPGRLRSMPYSVDYVVWVPEYSGLDVTVTDGETVIDGINGIQVIKSMRGPVRLSGVSGTVLLTAFDGDVDVSIRERFWRGPGLDAATAKGSITLTAPKSFSTEVDAAALGGVLVDGKLVKSGRALETVFGSGGSRIKLAAPMGTVSITLSDDDKAAPAQAEEEPEPEPRDR